MATWVDDVLARALAGDAQAWNTIKQVGSGSVPIQQAAGAANPGVYSMTNLPPEIAGAPQPGRGFTMVPENQVISNKLPAVMPQPAAGASASGTASRSGNAFRAAMADLGIGTGETAGATAKTAAGVGSKAGKLAQGASKVFGGLAKIGGPLAVGLPMAQEAMNLQSAQGQIPTDVTNPLERTLAQLVEGQDDPNLSNIENLRNRIATAPVRSTINAASAVYGLGEDFFNWATTPSGEWAKKVEKDQPNLPDASQPPLMAWAEQMMEQTNDGQQQGYFDLDLGLSPEYAQAPIAPMPAMTDTQAIRDWMDKAAPKASDPQDTKDMKEMALLGGLAQGLANAAGAQNVGQALLQVGLGVMGGRLSGTRAEKEAKIKDAAAQQQYAQLMAGNELKLASLEQNERQRLLDVAYKNALVQHKDAIQKAATEKPKFLSMNGPMAMYEVTENGKRSIRVFNMETLAGQRMAKNKAAQQTGGDVLMAEALAGAQAPGQDPMSIYSLVAGQLINSGQAANVFGPEEYEQLTADVMSQSAMVPGTDTQKGELYQNQLSGRLAGVLMNKPEYLANAANFSPYAAMLLAQMQKSMKTKPSAGIQLDVPSTSSDVGVY